MYRIKNNYKSNRLRRKDMLSTLQEQIEVAARTIATDSYAMSIGEIIK